MPGPARVVLDTNVVLDLLHFRDPAAAGVEAALSAGLVVAVTSESCLEELRRVLDYPQFGLGAAEQSGLFDRYVAITQRLPLEGFDGASLPRCTDPDDQKFLELAWHSSAHCLVTKDKALLRMARRMSRLGGFSIVLPAAFVPPAPDVPRSAVA
jgi:putative PIN family toxin of toxin-antitoxin system